MKQFIIKTEGEFSYTNRLNEISWNSLGTIALNTTDLPNLEIQNYSESDESESDELESDESESDESESDESESDETVEECFIRRMCDPSDAASPFHHFIGNGRAVSRLSRAAHAAMKDSQSAGWQNFALLGPASTGKTTLARLYAKTVDVPFIEIHPRTHATPDDLAEAVLESLDEVGRHVELLPPMVIFIDEVHDVRGSMITALLKATERKDAKLQMTSGRTLDFSRCCWIIATTDRGDLFDAFDTRFSKIHLTSYTRSQISQIVRIHYPLFCNEACDMIAKFSPRTPREALDFAAEVKTAKEWDLHSDWKDLILQVAEDRDIDGHGMHRIRLSILSALSHGPVAKTRLQYHVNVKPDEIERFWMPELLTSTEDQPALVNVTMRGYRLTDAGRKELAIRNIPFEDD